MPEKNEWFDPSPGVEAEQDERVAVRLGPVQITNYIPGNVSQPPGAIEVFDQHGTSLGFIPVYASIIND